MAEASPYEFAAPLLVAVDVRNPLAYLALAPTCALADDLDLEIDWVPFEHSPFGPPPEPADDRGLRHRRFRALYRERDVERYARVQGLVIQNLYRATDPSLTGAGLLAAKAHSSSAVRAYLTRVFERHWNESLDVEDANALEALLHECGVADPALSARRGEYAGLQERLRATGLFTTPAYVVEGEVFYGRAHLPMIRWILEGRRGVAPI